MAIRLTIHQALRLRMRGQALLPHQIGGGDVARLVSRQVCGLQAQDLFAALLGVRVRAPGSALADCEGSRLANRSVIWTWLMRGTLHLVPADDVEWLLAVLGPPLLAATARRRGELGLDEATYAAGLTVIREHLASTGQATREEVVQALTAAGLPAGYRFERHLLYRAALEGVVCFGPDRGDVPGEKPTFVLLSDWLLRTPILPTEDGERRQGLGLLAERYLAAYAPATLADFSAWSGLNVRDLRAGWDAITPHQLEVEVAGRPAWVPEARMTDLDEQPRGVPHVRLLPAFDTYILGHKTRDLIEDGAYASCVKGGGMLPAMVLLDGRILGIWRTNRTGRKVAITVEPFEPFSQEIEAAIAAEVADIERFLK